MVKPAVVIVALAFAVPLASAPAGQGTPAPGSSAAAPVPVEREPVHRPVFQNASVGVLEVKFPPGYVSLWHTHATDNVTVRIETGLTRVDRPGQDGTPETAAIGRVVFNDASTPYTHRVNNLGTSTVFTYDVEILASSPVALAAGAADDLAGHEIVIDNGRVRATRIRVAAGAAERAHTHRRGWLEVGVRGARAGRYRWHAAGDPVRLAGPAEVVEIEPK
jgi:hypothetical protein